MEVVHEKCKSQGDFLQQFDLFAGTSVGGCAALVGNQLGTT